MHPPTEHDFDLQPKGGLDLAPGVSVPASVVRFAFSRSSGPGGQNVNKRSTKAELRIRLVDLPLHPAALDRLRHQARARIAGDAPNDELLIVADEHRSQPRNRDECLARLRAIIIAAQVIPKPRRKTKPSRGSKERRLASKKARSEIKARRRSAE